MASFWYDIAKYKVAQANVDLDTFDIRAMLCMSNTTADTEQDKLTISGFTTLDEYDGSGYARVDLGATTVTNDTTNHRTEIDVADFTFGATVGAGTRNAVGMMYYVYVDGTPGNDWPFAWCESGGFPFNGNGGAINVTVNTEGLLQIT